jgi:hypothetical protein
MALKFALYPETRDILMLISEGKNTYRILTEFEDKSDWYKTYCVDLPPNLTYYFSNDPESKVWLFPFSSYQKIKDFIKTLHIKTPEETEEFTKAIKLHTDYLNSHKYKEQLKKDALKTIATEFRKKIGQK